MIFSAKGYEVEYIDVAASEEAKKKMRDLSGNPKALPPQIFNEDQYCGVSSTHYCNGQCEGVDSVVYCMHCQFS